MLTLAEEVRPAASCLVPEKREELTTEGGLDVVGQEAHIRAAVQRLQAIGSEVSLFIDPDFTQIDATVRTGAPARVAVTVTAYRPATVVSPAVTCSAAAKGGVPVAGDSASLPPGGGALCVRVTGPAWAGSASALIV